MGPSCARETALRGKLLPIRWLPCIRGHSKAEVLTPHFFQKSPETLGEKKIMNKQEKMTALLNYMSERSISVADAMQFLQPLQESAASKVSLKPPPKAPVQSPESSLPARMESPKDGQHLKKVIITLDSVPRTFMCAMTSRKAGICPVCEVETFHWIQYEYQPSKYEHVRSEYLKDNYNPDSHKPYLKFGCISRKRALQRTPSMIFNLRIYPSFTDYHHR